MPLAESPPRWVEQTTPSIHRLPRRPRSRPLHGRPPHPGQTGSASAAACHAQSRPVPRVAGPVVSIAGESVRAGKEGCARIRHSIRSIGQTLSRSLSVQRIESGLTLVTRMRWNSDPRRIRSSDPGDRRLCSRRVKRRATFSSVRSGDSPTEGKAVTAMIAIGVKSEDAIGTKVNEDATGPVIDDSALHRALKERGNHNKSLEPSIHAPKMEMEINQWKER